MRGIKKEWNDAAESWAEFVRKGKDYYRDELNNPATFKLIGDVKDKRVLDLACGEGYSTRILATKGAKVIGADFSEKMIELARREEARMKQDINYYVLDASNLEKFPSNYFDLVTCFMSLQDMKNYKKAISEVSRVLRNQGRFVFSIPHPCFETIAVKGKRISAGERYFGAVKYPIQWNMERLKSPFRTSSFHRTLTDYFEALFRNKLFVSRLVEPKPTKKGLQKYPALRQVLTRPQSIVIESVEIIVDLQ
ncbi:MAG: class I SAM-dependent methyltransferase [Candidatus Bathyarchaeota archaeon]|nr:class I SAM-dependent methyltransferase [Candidatus Bathyarchaeota archaeon]MDH5787443.1 class I SAM-dependent methyltransferase [Candidatus Bathyarchaeota archaeon]